MCSTRNDLVRGQSQQAPGLSSGIRKGQADGEDNVSMLIDVKLEAHLLIPLRRFAVLCPEGRQVFLVVYSISIRRQ